jgi:hypothetical protein
VCLKSLHVNVSRRNVQRAAHVQDNVVPKLKKVVEQGRMPVREAAEVIKLPEQERNDLLVK